MRRGMWVLVAAGLAATNVSAAASVTSPLPGFAVRATGEGLTAPSRSPSGVPGDVNGDTYAEVAVGEPGNAQLRGAVHLFYGQRKGLVVDAAGTARNDQYLTQGTSGVPGAAEPGDAFGTSTVLADLNGDGCADLVVGSPGEDRRSGRVDVIFGSPTGLRSTDVQGFSLADLPGSPGPAANQGLGQSLTAGDLDGDGTDDLVAGVEGLRVAGKPYAGALAVVYGGHSGLDLGRSVLVSQASPGVPGAATRYGNFGRAIATGDFDGNGTTELAVSSGGGGGSEGAVQILERTGSGFRGPAPLRPGVAGLPGDRDQPCEFGYALASGDVHGDGRDDLAVGDPTSGCTSEDDDDGPGAVYLVPGSPTGLTATGARRWTQASPGVQGTARPGDRFGSSLAMAPLDRNDTADLAVGASELPGGSVTVLLGGRAGLTTNGIGGTRYTQATAGIPGTDERLDLFGQAITAAFVQSPTQATLIISTPGEDVGAIRDAGAVTQVPISRSGPDPRTARTLTADTPGVQGQAKPGEYFGAVGGFWG
ncbi:integrin alpha [uncultured Friedmanniella sp.]|uniref:integrin alpha n=1 Tax=uncultured Friedmanniella sp. TaxID=335381 RepID=UPI0035C968F5